MHPVKNVKISCPYGYVFSWNNREHRGIDYAGNIGDKVYSISDGFVKLGYEQDGYGLYVIISKDEYEFIYAHLNKVYVKEKDVVSKNQVIGEVGNSGASTGPHLHFEIRKNMKTINPKDFE